jgi:threonyl-tRNA synthetase
MERFIGLLIEHTAGNFPLWLSPEQVAVLPISEKYHEYAGEIFRTLQQSDITGFIDHRDEKVQRKIRDAEVKKVPFMLIVGEKEAGEGTVSVRRHGQGDQGSVSVADFIASFKDEANVEKHLVK